MPDQVVTETDTLRARIEELQRRVNAYQQILFAVALFTFVTGMLMMIWGAGRG